MPILSTPIQHNVGSPSQSNNQDKEIEDIPLLGIYPEETGIEKDICIPIFIATLFTIVRIWKQPRCPLTDEWIKKLWYIHDGILFSYKKEHI